MIKILFICHGRALGTVISGDEVRQIGANRGGVIGKGLRFLYGWVKNSWPYVEAGAKMPASTYGHKILNLL